MSAQWGVSDAGEWRNIGFLCDCGIFVAQMWHFRLFFGTFLERQSDPALSSWDTGDSEAARNLTLLAGFLLWKRKRSTIFGSVSQRQNALGCKMQNGAADAAKRRMFFLYVISCQNLQFLPFLESFRSGNSPLWWKIIDTAKWLEILYFRPNYNYF